MKKNSETKIQKLDLSEQAYQESIGTLKVLIEAKFPECETDNQRQLINYFRTHFKFQVDIMTLEQELGDDYFKNYSFEELMEKNRQLYKDIKPENYELSYCNPSHAVRKLSEAYGGLFATISTEIRKGIEYAFMHRKSAILSKNQMLIELYEHVMSQEYDYASLLAIYREHKLLNHLSEKRRSLLELYSPSFDFYTKIHQCDLSDLRYLFRAGKQVTENEVKIAQKMATYSDDELSVIAESIVEAYKKGFEVDRKDISLRSYVAISCSLGQEKLVEKVIEAYEKHGLQGFVSSLLSTRVNEQFDYDHRFDGALILDERFIEFNDEMMKKSAKSLEANLKAFSGSLDMERFGEEPFSPVKKNEMIAFNEAQMDFEDILKTDEQTILEMYLPETEISYCMVAFPTPEIGPDFEQIFEDVLRINALPSDKCEQIQQIMIDALDKGEYVWIKGQKGNLTDLKIKMNDLRDSSVESNYMNCGADVNIPIGEVFTTPVLEGSNGVLHVEETYLDGFMYKDFKLVFEEGMVTNYECKNFDDPEMGRQYIQENLLFPHKTLPMSEFAIGTNSFAYMVAQKYQILHRMPILIVEKMGPHIAIGDTCYSWREDWAVYNQINKKEIVAKDNSLSIKRKEDVHAAYTNRHTDITLPFDALGLISVILPDGGEIDIIRNGRFVLEGTETLNGPFDKSEGMI